jgi:glycosyltransferase involved in cell wall biosynthesis
MKLHLVGLPHTQTTDDVTVCAFSSKAVKFGRMMTELGYEVILYWGPRNDAVCAEHVPLFTKREQTKWFGKHDANTLPSVAVWDPGHVGFRTMNERAIEQIQERANPAEDLLLILAGWAHKPIVDAFPTMTACEWAAGYEGICLPFVCFESYAWQHYLYGKYNMDGRFYDTVIPNFFYPEHFQISETKDDYLLYLGRLISRKGVRTASEIAKYAGRKLVVAGSGALEWGDGFIRCMDGTVLEGDVEYVGTVGVKERGELLSKAHALLAVTDYIEPFGAVAVEAQLSGTPVISVDWGAFSETVNPGVTGYRFRTLLEAVDAVDACGGLDPQQVRQAALDGYSIDAVGPMYDTWFKRLGSLRREGWYEMTPH